MDAANTNIAATQEWANANIAQLDNNLQEMHQQTHTVPSIVQMDTISIRITTIMPTIQNMDSTNATLQAQIKTMQTQVNSTTCQRKLWPWHHNKNSLEPTTSPPTIQVALLYKPPTQPLSLYPAPCCPYHPPPGVCVCFHLPKPAPPHHQTSTSFLVFNWYIDRYPTRIVKSGAIHHFYNQTINGGNYTNITNGMPHPNYW